MTISGAIVAFFLIWWLVLFTVLPIGVRGEWESGKPMRKGIEPGAPVEAGLKRKFLWTTLLTIPVWLAVLAAIYFLDH